MQCTWLWATATGIAVACAVTACSESAPNTGDAGSGGTAGSGGSVPSSGGSSGGASDAQGKGGISAENGGAVAATGGTQGPSPEAGAGGSEGGQDGGDGKSETGAGPEWTGTLRGRFEKSSGAQSVAVAMDGTVLVGVSSLRNDGAQRGRGALIRVDAKSGAYTTYPVPEAKFVFAVAFGPDGDLYFAGTAVENNAEKPMIGRYRANGEPRWTTVLDGDNVGEPHAIGVAADGSAIVSGVAGSGPLPLQKPAETGAGYVIKMSAEGAHLWTSRREGTFSAVDATGNVYVMESGVVPGLPLFGGKDHAGLVKLSPAGDRLWKTLLEYPAEVNDAFVGLMNGSSVAIDTSGTISAAADMTYSRCIPNECATQPVLGRFGADGALKKAVLLGPETTGLRRTAQSKAGTRLFALITGKTTIGPLGAFASDGALLWGSIAIGGLNGYGADIAGDGAGDLVLVGNIPIPNDPIAADWFIERRRGSNGSVY